MEVEVLNAVAPYDHESNVDSFLLEMRIAQGIDQRIDECLREQGFDERPRREIPERDDPQLHSHLMFPDIDTLARDGIALVVEGGESPDALPPDAWEPPPGWDEAVAQCLQQLPEGDEIHPAQERFAQVRGAWEQEMDALETDEEIRRLADAFSDCLREEGIPAEASSNERRFLFYVDGLVLAEGGDTEEQQAITERLGRLYAQCGRELFLARERLRAEQRPDFLAEHAETIRELSEVLYGAGDGGDG